MSTSCTTPPGLCFTLLWRVRLSLRVKSISHSSHRYDGILPAWDRMWSQISDLAGDLKSHFGQRWTVDPHSSLIVLYAAFWDGVETSSWTFFRCLVRWSRRVNVASQVVHTWGRPRGDCLAAELEIVSGSGMLLSTLGGFSAAEIESKTSIQVRERKMYL